MPVPPPTPPPHTSPVADDALAAAVAELQLEYLDSMPVRLAELRAALDRATEDPGTRTTVQRGGHRIAGTAATIGLPEIGDVGRAIEHYAMRCGWTAAEVGALARAVDLLADLAADARLGRPLSFSTGDPRLRTLREWPW